MKVFVISLKRAIERRTFMVKQLEELELDYEIVDAVDYQQLSPDEFKSLTDEEAVKNDPWLTKGAIACALSHVKVFKKIVADKVDIALVLEDDAVLPKDIKYVLKLARENIKQDEIIALSYYNRNDRPLELSTQGQVNLGKNLQLLAPVDLHELASAMAYVIPSEVAEKLQTMIVPVATQLDYWSDYLVKGGFNSFRCLYPMSFYAASFRTTLDYAASATWMSKAASVVRKYNIPILIKVLEKRDERSQLSRYAYNFVDKKALTVKGVNVLG